MARIDETLRTRLIREARGQTPGRTLTVADIDIIDTMLEMKSAGMIAFEEDHDGRMVMVMTPAGAARIARYPNMMGC